MVMINDASEQFVVQGIWYFWKAGLQLLWEIGGDFSPLWECQEVSRMGQVLTIGCCHQSRDLWLLLSQAGYQNLSSVPAHVWSPTCALPQHKSICCASHPYRPYQTKRTSKAGKTNDVLSASKSPPLVLHLSLEPRAERWWNVCILKLIYLFRKSDQSKTNSIQCMQW